MPSELKLLFPSFIYHGRLADRIAKPLNQEFRKEILALEEVDMAGQKWSQKHYQGGYSSYSSLGRLHETSPNFSELEKLLAPHVKKFTQKLMWDLGKRKLRMTTCWANSMGFGTHHTMHMHPFCALSGVYYVNLPKGSSALKLEDPRLSGFMSAPPRRSSAPKEMQNYLSIPARAGEFILFESWMRHEVPPHRSETPRLSISFNYEW